MTLNTPTTGARTLRIIAKFWQSTEGLFYTEWYPLTVMLSLMMLRDALPGSRYFPLLTNFNMSSPNLLTFDGSVLSGI